MIIIPSNDTTEFREGLRAFCKAEAPTRSTFRTSYGTFDVLDSVHSTGVGASQVLVVNFAYSKILPECSYNQLALFTDTLDLLMARKLVPVYGLVVLTLGDLRKTFVPPGFNIKRWFKLDRLSESCFLWPQIELTAQILVKDGPDAAMDVFFPKDLKKPR